jgi:acyl-CoA dehydrogenase
VPARRGGGELRMNFELSDEQKMLATEARRLLTECSPPDRLRAIIDSTTEWDANLWGRLRESGFLGAAIPGEFGGLGLGEIDLGLICLELGRVNAAVPHFSSLVLAAEAIRLAGSTAQKMRFLPQLATGEFIATFALRQNSADARVPIATASADGVTLKGTTGPVPDAGIAHAAIVSARHGARSILTVVDLSDPRIKKTKLQSFDQLRAYYALHFDGVPAELMEAAPVDAVLPALFDRAAVQAAFEAVGGAEACIAMARDYAAQRMIFGRPLASYQAIKHKLADILVATELTRSSAYYAACMAATDPAELPEAAAAARLMALDAFEAAARECLQIHGGVGYTFESNCHFYYRRERTVALTLQDRQYWADRLIDQLQRPARTA